MLSARAMPEMFSGFEVLPDSERGIEPITLVPFNPVWPSRFQSWRSKLLDVLDSTARRIDHIGSTAVPGLIAKDVVDIQVSVDDIKNEHVYVQAIESLGVQLRIREDDHRYFRPFASRPREVHVHVCDAGSVWERRHLLFVAYLRQDGAARDRYAQEKLAAISHWADDRAAYTETKDAVIAEILARAEEWALATGWTL